MTSKYNKNISTTLDEEEEGGGEEDYDDDDEVFTDYEELEEEKEAELDDMKTTQDLKNKLSDIYESQKRDMLIKTWKTAIRIFTILVIMIIFLCSLVLFYATSDKYIYFLLVNSLLACILFNCLVIT